MHSLHAAARARAASPAPQAHDGAIGDTADQLAAGRIDIIAARAPHRGHHAAAQQQVAKLAMAASLERRNGCQEMD